MLGHWTFDACFVALWVILYQRRRWHLKQTVSEMPDVLQAQLGPAPNFAPPPAAACPKALQAYAQYHRRSRIPGTVLFVFFVAIVLIRYAIES
ncbi:hypothetical protein [Epibacterium ulvae]|uniref:Uncharacterized protein n=1 Tax=Epibacterium ulvae TaxID=1156985 RepID=A0A1G5R026_9RHOB|nr:hypothetical protein [Epibacterium ulvae]SCZ66679.1 hypothetical protein SAMN04488118_106234 [Epibacterium ulvae]